MKDAYYFSHDSNARNDQKIIALRSVKGMKGYGIYFAIIEIMREANAYRLPLNFQTLAFDIRESQEDIEDVVLNYELFTISDDGRFFHSESLLRRMQRLDSIRVKRILAGEKGGKANASRLLNDCSSSKVKESKVNQSIFTPPSLREVEEYFKENNIPLSAISFHSHYEASNWYRGKTKIKNWKACVNTWLRNNDSRSGNVQSQAKKPIRISASEAIAQQS